MQAWTLDLLGSWTELKEDLDGDGLFTGNKEIEDRAHNQANEITSLDIQGLTGTPFTQHRDKAGNWTRQRRSNAVDTRYTHDAWNRLVKVELGTAPTNTLGTYEYNGLHWRTVKHTGSDAERRMYYSSGWQLLEERADSDTTDGGGAFAEETCAQTVWGLRYIDDAVLRRTDDDQDYDYADAGERTDYFVTDTQFSVCAVIDDAAALQERVSYSPYGHAQHHFPGDIDGDGDLDSSDTGGGGMATVRRGHDSDPRTVVATQSGGHGTRQRSSRHAFTHRAGRGSSRRWVPPCRRGEEVGCQLETGAALWR